MSVQINRDGNYTGILSSYSTPQMGSGPKLGNVGTSKFEGGLKKVLLAFL